MLSANATLAAALADNAAVHDFSPPEETLLAEYIR